MAHNGDPVVNANSERIGFVTSCAIDGERFLTGQAYLENAYTKESTPILIHQGAARAGVEETVEVASHTVPGTSTDSTITDSRRPTLRSG